MWYHRCTEPCGNSSFNVLRSELTWRPMICCWNWTLTQRAHSNVYNTHLHMAVFPIASSVVLMVFWNSCQLIHSRARYKIDKIRGEEKEGYLKFERPPCKGNHRLKNFMHIFFGMKFWTQGQEAIGWPALCCPGNPDGVQQVKYRKPKRIKAVTPKYCSFPSFKVPLNPFVLTFQIFDLDPEVNQHSSRNRWIWGCPWYRGRWRTLASNWGAWDVSWKMPRKWGSHYLWKIFCSKNSGLKMGSNLNLWELKQHVWMFRSCLKIKCGNWTVLRCSKGFGTESLLPSCFPTMPRERLAHKCRQMTWVLEKVVSVDCGSLSVGASSPLKMVDEYNK